MKFFENDLVPSNRRWPYLTRPAATFPSADRGPESVLNERQGTCGYLRVPKGAFFSKFNTNIEQ